MAQPAARARDLALVRTGPRPHAPDEVFLRSIACDRLAPATGAARPSAVGDRTAIHGTQNRARPRSFRRPVLSRLAPSRGAHRRRVCLLATRTHEAGCRSRAHVA